MRTSFPGLFLLQIGRDNLQKKSPGEEVLFSKTSPISYRKSQSPHALWPAVAYLKYKNKFPLSGLLVYLTIGQCPWVKSCPQNLRWPRVSAGTICQPMSNIGTTWTVCNVFSTWLAERTVQKNELQNNVPNLNKATQLQVNRVQWKPSFWKAQVYCGHWGP